MLEAPTKLAESYVRNGQSRAQCARGLSGQLRRVVDLANRTVGRLIGLQGYFVDKTSHGNTRGLGYYGAMQLLVAGLTIVLALRIGSALMLFEVRRTADKSRMLEKAERRLRAEH